MTNIIKFPKTLQNSSAKQRQEVPKPAATAKISAGQGTQFLSGLFGAVWLVTVLISPFLQWVLKYDVLFQMIRMLYYWDTPGVHAGWTFLLHFCALSGLTWYVAFGKPKDW